jgi:hypothetical protein
MNFFVFDQTRRQIIIGNDFWIFIALWLPLTVLTMALYIFIVRLDAHLNGKVFRWPWDLRPRKRNTDGSNVENGDAKLQKAASG